MVTGTIAHATAVAVVATVLQLTGIGEAVAQGQAPRPTIEVTPAPSAVRAAAGTTAAVRLSVQLPIGIHVQSDKPRDPSVIPALLTLTPPSGMSLERVVYPKAVDLAQAGRAKSLAVFSGDFTVEARLIVTADMPPGDYQVLATFRYQACSTTVCFPPTRRTVQWTLTVTDRPSTYRPEPPHVRR